MTKIENGPIVDPEFGVASLVNKWPDALATSKGDRLVEWSSKAHPATPTQAQCDQARAEYQPYVDVTPSAETLTDAATPIRVSVVLVGLVDLLVAKGVFTMDELPAEIRNHYAGFEPAVRAYLASLPEASFDWR